MAEFWKQVRLPLLVVSGTLFAVATIILIAYSVYWMTKNPEALGRFVGGGVSVFMSMFVSAVVALLYFVPTAVAAVRRHHNAAPIFIVNGFSGLTALLFPAFLAPGVGALAWAVSATPVPVTARKLDRAA